MSIFDFPARSASQFSNSKDLVARYRRLRSVQMRLNNELVSRLPMDVLREGAKRIGILHGDMFVFDNEDETSVLMDYCIYDVYRKERNAVDQFLCDCPADPESDEMVCLHAMQHATYTLLVVLGVEPGVGCHVRNLFTEETRLLVDMGLSATGQPGAIIATRLLDYGDYVTTSGAALPLGILHDEALEDWQRHLRAGRQDDNFDPAPLIRECLRHGASSNIQYEEPGGRRPPKAEKTPRRVEHPAERKPALATRQASQAASNRRCRCGSGKMYKNCCGKR
jgi:hypothetical protein